jgi:hypothetical protein
MKQRLLARLEPLTVLAGGLCMSVALAAVDWRAGLFLAGLLLTVSALDIRWRRP